MNTEQRTLEKTEKKQNVDSRTAEKSQFNGKTWARGKQEFGSTKTIRKEEAKQNTIKLELTKHAHIYS